MKFSTQEDMEAPIAAVFEMLSSFENYERAAMRRGADVRRVDGLPVPGIGMKWDAQFDLRGKQRSLSVEVITYDPPNEMVMELTSPGLYGSTSCELIALSRARTRIMIALEVRPQTLAARVMLQPLKLTKATLNKRFKARAAQYLKEIEAGYQARA
ncbi:SRPBCC family protein [uncultured Roseobacter sp.]|uniref:SRPBCC family protein n=1 Tax=uncultured Roseobacter sp. TaxID=114847 RepID=UPI00260333A8|nr:SRPBCC family protein [uncultured Roseobacter sp.]